MSPDRLSPGSKTIRVALFGLVGMLALAYLCDFGWYEIRRRVRWAGPANSSVHRIRLLAIPGKANKVEYQIDALRPEEDVPCTRTIFRQSSDANPCWYVARHAHDPIQM